MQCRVWVRFFVLILIYGFRFLSQIHPQTKIYSRTCNLFQVVCQVFIYSGVIDLLLSCASGYLRNQEWKWAIRRKDHLSPHLTFMLLKSALAPVPLGREGLLMYTGSGALSAALRMASFFVPLFAKASFNPHFTSSVIANHSWFKDPWSWGSLFLSGWFCLIGRGKAQCQFACGLCSSQDCV